MIKNLTGMRFGKLVALAPTEKRDGSGGVVWRCRCDCGSEVDVGSGSLLSGHTKSCGCSRRFRAVDLYGRRSGRLVAVEKTSRRTSGGNVVWWCRCDCGVELMVSSGDLVSGAVRSCGCSRGRDLSGRRFGRLVAVKLTGGRRSSFLEWLCKCDCGNEVKVASGCLVGGHTRSCGCLSAELASKRNRRNLTGQRFGRLVVLEPTSERSRRNIVWRCQCDCGNVAMVKTSNLVGGNTQSCGCLHIERLSESRARQVFPVKDTTIEIAVQKLLKKMGVVFEKHKTLKSLGFTEDCVCKWLGYFKVVGEGYSG